VTNAVFGFTSMLVNLLRDQKPDAIAVAFDLPTPTFRHERVSTYKATRDAAPDILRQQMGLTRQVVESLDLPIFEVPGFEADDVIATLATQGRDAGDDVVICTGDRDSYQLVEDPHVKVLYNKRGVSEYALYDEAGILERTGVTPALYPQYAALRGDPSDNLPGVPGVGEKTAAKLITTYGGIDGIFEHLDAQTPKLRENLAANEANVRQNAEVMVLVRDVPLDRSLADLSWSPDRLDIPEIRRLFEFLEFNTLFDRLAEAIGTDWGPSASEAEVLEAEVEVLDTAEAAAAAIRALLLAGTEPVAVAPAWTGVEGRSPLEGIALVTDGSAGAVAWIAGELLGAGPVTAALGELCAAEGRPLAAHQAKPLVRALTGLDVDVRSLQLDTALAAYLLDPAETRYLLEELVVRYAGARIP
jgi:DNA polymerase-1